MRSIRCQRLRHWRRQRQRVSHYGRVIRTRQDTCMSTSVQLRWQGNTDHTGFKFEPVESVGANRSIVECLPRQRRLRCRPQDSSRKRRACGWMPTTQRNLLCPTHGTMPWRFTPTYSLGRLEEYSSMNEKPLTSVSVDEGTCGRKRKGKGKGKRRRDTQTAKHEWNAQRLTL